MTQASLFKIDTRSPLPLNVQIREQIKWLIGKGILKPGDPLPSTNQLAEQLSVNRNTVQTVYTQLKEEGLLVIMKGRGTRVADQEQVDAFKQQHPYVPFVENLVKEALDANYSVEDVLLSAFAFVQLFGQPLAKKTRYLFFECRNSACIFYLDEIKRITEAEIDTIDIFAPEDVRNEAMRKADVIVTTQDLAPKVRKFVGSMPTPVITVGSTNDVSLLLNMLRP